MSLLYSTNVNKTFIFNPYKLVINLTCEYNVSRETLNIEKNNLDIFNKLFTKFIKYLLIIYITYKLLLWKKFHVKLLQNLTFSVNKIFPGK